MGNLSWQDPLWLALLPLLAVLAWHHHRRRDTGAQLYSGLPVDRSAVWRIHLPFYARLAALALMLLALGRPQLGYTWEENLTEGVDIEIVLDISGSMGAEDFQPRNRLHVAREVVKDFVSRRPADRLGLVVFSGTALTRSPLTTDRRMLAQLIDSVELNTLPDGTAIGVALANAAARLRASEASSKVIVLVTDGVNNAGAIDPVSAAAVCKGLGIKIYTIGVGTAGRVPVPVPRRDPVTGRRETRRVKMNVEVDEELLRRIAGDTGGAFYKATDREALVRIFGEIDQLEKTPIQTRRFVRHRDVFQPFVWTALALVLLPLATVALNLTAEP